MFSKFFWIVFVFFQCVFIMIISSVQNVPSAHLVSNGIEKWNNLSKSHELESVYARMISPHKVHNTILADHYLFSIWTMNKLWKDEKTMMYIIMLKIVHSSLIEPMANQVVNIETCARLKETTIHSIKMLHLLHFVHINNYMD